MCPPARASSTSWRRCRRLPVLGADDVSDPDISRSESGNQREHPQYTKVVATRRDITKLLGPTKWTYFYLYVVPTSSAATRSAGWSQTGRTRRWPIEETCHKQGEPQVLTLHSDRGA